MWRLLRSALPGVFAFVLLAGATVLTRDAWLPLFLPGSEKKQEAPPVAAPPQSVKLSEQAYLALRPDSRPVAVQPYWRTVSVPGAVVDRPGTSDRGVAAPAAGIVAQIHAFPGEAVRPGDALVTLRLVSEYLQNAQSELFKTAREIRINRDEYKRLSAPEVSVPAGTLIALENQDRRLQASLQALRHDLLARGLTTAQVDEAEDGKFTTHVTVVAPARHPDQPALVAASGGEPIGAALAYEVQELKVELGQQVQAGQVLAYVANHQALLIEGRAFKQEAALIENAARNGWPVEVEFLTPASPGTSPGSAGQAKGEANAGWPELKQTFIIRSLGNSVDPASRTFPFYMPLANQSRPLERDGKTFLAWQYRPGQRVRLRIPVERIEKAIVLPAEAVVREGAETYIFRENGDLFDRRPVRVLFEDGRRVILEQDRNISEGRVVAHNAAAALNRALKAQAMPAATAGGHFHADGTFHAH